MQIVSVGKSIYIRMQPNDMPMHSNSAWASFVRELRAVIPPQHHASTVLVVNPGQRCLLCGAVHYQDSAVHCTLSAPITAVVFDVAACNQCRERIMSTPPGELSSTEKDALIAVLLAQRHAARRQDTDNQPS